MSTAEPGRNRLAACSGALAALLLALAGCGQSQGGVDAGDSLSPLAVSQKLVEAKIPCENQSLEKRETSTIEVGLFQYSYPSGTYLTCEATGGPFRIILWNDESGLDPYLLTSCVEQSVAPLRVEYQDVLAEADALEGDDIMFMGPELALGTNWVAVSTADSIVTTTDLANALGGTASTSKEICADQPTDLAEVVAAERQRLGALASEQQEQDQMAALRGNVSQQVLLAGDSSVDPNILLELAKVGDPAVLCLLSSNDAATEEILDAILERTGKSSFGSEKDEAVDKCVARSPATSVATLELLTRRGNEDLARLAQRNLDNR